MVDIIKIIIRELYNIDKVLEVDPETSYKFEMEKDTIVSQLRSLTNKNDVAVYSVDGVYDINISDCYDLKTVISKIRNHHRKKKSFKKTLRQMIINKIAESTESEEHFNKFNNDKFIDLVHRHIIAAMDSNPFNDFTLLVRNNTVEVIIPEYHTIILSL